MTTPQFIDWLDRKMVEHGDGKLIPPADVIARELEDRLEAQIRADITEKILREANLEGQITEALSKIERPTSATLTSGIKEMFEAAPENEWRDHVEHVVANISGESVDDDNDETAENDE